MPRVYPEDVTACCYVEVKHRCTGLPHDQANARPSRRRAPQRIGYAQIGPEQADLREAVTELCALGVESHHVYVDRGPWLRAKDRPEFQRVLALVEPGDILVAASPARLARSHSDLANIVEKLTGADVEVEIAGEQLCTLSPARLLRLSAQLQVDIISAALTTRESLDKQRDPRGGHPRLTPAAQIALQELFDDAGMSRDDLARLFAVSSATLHRTARPRSAD